MRFIRRWKSIRRRSTGSHAVVAIQPSTDAMCVRRHADTKVLNLRFADGFEQDIL